jgi:hypothetical protein
MSSNKELAVEIRAEVGAYIQGLIDAMRATETNAKKMRNSLENVSSKNSQMSFQNLGYQVNDVAAQFAAGTNVLQAFGQQAGQALQAFGPWGSIIGAAVAVAASLSAKLMDGKDAAEKAEKAHKDYAGAVDFARQITEKADETSRRHSEERRQEVIETLKAAAAEKERAKAILVAEIAQAKAGAAAAAALKDRMAAAGTGQTARDAGVVDVGTQRADQRIANLEDMLLELNKSAAETGGLLNTALNPPKGWDDPGGGFKPEKAPNPEKQHKADRDALEDYMTSLRQSVELQKLSDRERAGQEAVYRAESAALQEQKTLTADKAAEVRRLAIAAYDLKEAQKPEKDDGIEAYIEKLKDSADVMAVENRERAIRQALIEAQNIAMKEGTVLTDEQTAAITNLAGATYDLKDAQAEQKDATAENKKLMHELSNTFESAFEDAIIAGKKFSDVLSGIGEDIAKLILRQSVTKPLADAVQSATKDIKWGDLASGAMDWLSGTRATGGAVNAGGSYLVGERGPEIVKFNSPGTVIPNNRIGGMGGESPVVVNQTIQISTGVAATVRAEVANMLPQIASVTKASLAQDQARKGRSL